MSRVKRSSGPVVERTFRACPELAEGFASSGDKKFEGLQPWRMSPAEAGFGKTNQRKDTTLKGRFTGGMR
jgi:hypothetical protein